MIIKRGDVKILSIIPEEDLNETQKLTTKAISKNNKKQAQLPVKPADVVEKKENTN